MTKPTPGQVIQLHLDHKKTSMMIEMTGEDTVCVYSYGMPEAHQRPNLIFQIDGSQKVEIAPDLMGKCIDHVARCDYDALIARPLDHVLSVQIEGRKLRAMFIPVDGNDTLRYAHEYANHLYGPNYLSQMAVRPSWLAVQTSDVRGLLPGEPGFDEAYRSRLFVYELGDRYAKVEPVLQSLIPQIDRLIEVVDDYEQRTQLFSNLFNQLTALAPQDPVFGLFLSELTMFKPWLDSFGPKDRICEEEHEEYVSWLKEINTHIGRHI